MLNYKLQLMPIPLKGEYWKQIPLNIDLLQPKLIEKTHTQYLSDVSSSKLK